MAAMKIPSEDSKIAATAGAWASPAGAPEKEAMFGILTNKAPLVGCRPVNVDGSILQGDAPILQTYSPVQVTRSQRTSMRPTSADLIRRG